MIDGQAIMTKNLRSYLDGTRLSMSQVATKLGISKGYLSDVKNEKKVPKLDLGIKILKQCGADLETCKEWIESQCWEESEEYQELFVAAQENQKKRKLTQAVSKQLATDLDLLNAFLDILNQDSLGLPKREILERYGRKVVTQLESMVSAELLKADSMRFFGDDARLVLNRAQSYDLAEEVICEQRRRFEDGTLKGGLQFEVDDISDEGYEELKKVFGEYMKKSSEIIAKHKQTTKDGGRRFVLQSLLGEIGPLFGILLLFLVNIPVFAGGIEGGSFTDNSFKYETSGTFTLNGGDTKVEALKKAADFEQALLDPKTSPLRNRARRHCDYRISENPRVESYKINEFWLNQKHQFEVKVDVTMKCSPWAYREKERKASGPR